MTTAPWLLVAAATCLVYVGSQPTCDIPSGHQDGEFVRGPHEPKGGELCKQDDLVEIISRRCERRYCCEAGCTCRDDIHESSSACKDR
ncbi:hypothetical protein NP493_1958g00025 [Ridgeia piscesae]|uniref:Uncharacterized protein n=1 Tax=Ridgeia piscesae TaxID=27915 RepID=A0AAD9JPI4_RIDPI|nr:hypothetical protein NP493_1958g00025 [Ridgeia piscesae]